VVQGIDPATASIYAPISEKLKLVEGRLKQLKSGAPDDLQGLIDHILSSGGKRVRPAITLLAAGCHGTEPDWTVTMASAIELLHIATLVHDDTVDEAETRRGKATVSNLWGNNIAVLFGDYVFATSAIWVCETQNMRVIRRFSETIMELAAGQMSEFFSTYGRSRAKSEYEERIYRKTASLFSTAGETGAILGGSPESSIESLKDYGFNLGMAFQIMDDVLDFDGDAKQLGKPVGSDLWNGVLTLPGILLIEKFPENNPILKLFDDPTNYDHFNDSVELVHSSGVLTECYEVIRNYSLLAKNCLKNIPEGSSKTALLLLTDYIWERSR
jgi:geranylgeranyl pyrophosphate synthase